MALEFLANEKVAGTLALVDTVNGAAVAATFVNVTAASDSPNATASVDASGNVNIAGASAGSANVSVSADATYVDSNGTSQTKTLTTIIPVTIDAVVVTPDDVQLVVNFVAPTAQ